MVGRCFEPSQPQRATLGLERQKERDRDRDTEKECILVTRS